MNRKGIAGPLLEYIQNMAHYLRVLHGNDGMQVITLDIGDVPYTMVISCVIMYFVVTVTVMLPK